MLSDQIESSTLLARLAALTDLATPYAVRTVATLRVPDRLADGPQRLDALAAAVGAQAQSLGRLLRYLAHRGVFTEPEPEVFALTAVGRLLVEAGPTGQRQWLAADGLGYHMDLAYTALPTAIRTGSPSYAVVHGRDLWTELDDNPAWRGYFDALMLAQQRVTAPQVAALYPWAGVRHVFDVGGGNGELLAELLRSHTHLRGTLVDRPAAVRATAERFAGSDFVDRVTFQAGDFFAPLPTGGDVYIISRALTDWADDDATTILGRLVEAAGPQGRVLVVEVLPTDPHVPYRAPFDLQMLTTVGGRERTSADFAVLARSAGAEVTSVLSGTDGLVMIECTACESS